LYRIPHATWTLEPATQKTELSVGGSIFEPISPIFAMLVSVKSESPPTGVSLYLPPAWPHASTTGALPGARWQQKDEFRS
jgi:hypothetical protein